MKTIIGRNINTLIKSPIGGPNSNIVAPPMPGPKSTPSWRPVELSRTALCRVLAPDDVMDDQLAARPAEHAGHPMDDQQHARVPHLNRVGEK